MHPRRLASRFAVARLLRSLVAPLALALPPLLWVADATRRASVTPLGRDQGIFQYIGWALSRGEHDYRDIRDVNGPLTHLVHRVLLALGGADEHRFRILDLVITGATFAVVGACLPGLRSRRAPEVLDRVAWALAAWVVLSGQYLLYGYWDIAQRESFFDWFMLPSVALQLVAQRSLADHRKAVACDPHALVRDRGTRLLAVVGALSVIPCFGKPTYALFTLAQLLAIALDDDLGASRRKALRAFLLGGVFGVVSQLAVLFATGDALAYARIQVLDVPAMYRFIWPRTFAEILGIPGYAPTMGYAFITSAIVIGLILDGSMPRRALAIGLAPVVGIVTLIAQAKGFPYHFHPITAGMSLQWMLLIAWLAERCRTEPRKSLARLVPFLAAAVLAARVTTTMSGSPHLQSVFVAEKGMTPEDRESPDFLVYFNTVDFFPVPLRQTAAYLRAHTSAEERVQTYGMDPYVLFLAERMSATPYIYAYDINADAALGGGMLHEGLHPNGVEQARIRAIREAHEDDLLARLQKDPPAAFVFTDKSPLITWPDAWVDLQSCAPRTAAWVRAHYVQTAIFDVDRVWLRRDRAEGLAEATPIPLDLVEAQQRAEQASP